jgi:hypothetical protein
MGSSTARTGVLEESRFSVLGFGMCSLTTVRISVASDERQRYYDHCQTEVADGRQNPAKAVTMAEYGHSPVARDRRQNLN